MPDYDPKISYSLKNGDLYYDDLHVADGSSLLGILYLTTDSESVMNKHGSYRRVRVAAEKLRKTMQAMPEDLRDPYVLIALPIDPDTVDLLNQVITYSGRLDRISEMLEELQTRRPDLKFTPFHIMEMNEPLPETA